MSQIHDALQQVALLKAQVIERQLFRGYSGPARILGATFSLLCALLLGSSWVEKSIPVHLFAWGALCAIAVIMNYGALLLWFCKNYSVRKDALRLRPVVDPIPSLIVGGLVTAALMKYQAYDLLFGAWMCIYGLAHLSSRHCLPKSVADLGWFYIACGAACFLFLPLGGFLNPWPMGLTFFVGELSGGIIFFNTQKSIALAQNHPIEEATHE